MPFGEGYLNRHAFDFENSECSEFFCAEFRGEGSDLPGAQSVTPRLVLRVFPQQVPTLPPTISSLPPWLEIEAAKSTPKMKVLAGSFVASPRTNP